MGLDLDKYRDLFLEEARDHLVEMGRALLALEKDAGDADSIDAVFRMAHSVKSMAASLGYDPISELAHRLEDRMEGPRSARRLEGEGEIGLLFRALEGLEGMVEVVRETGGAPAARDDLVEALGRPAAAAGSEAPPPPSRAPDATPPPKKKSPPS